MKKYISLLLVLFFLVLEVFLLTNSNLIIENFNKTLNICLYTLMPTMFASILFSQILINIEFDKYIPNFIKNGFKKIFNINDNDVIVFFLSILSGYPNNAKLLLNNKNLNNIVHFTNFVNPIFLICTVGGIYLKNIKFSLLILVSHYISNVIMGILLRNNNTSEYTSKNSNNKNFLNIYSSSLKSTVSTLSTIFSNILFFSIILSLFNNISNFSYGLIEFSTGIYKISLSNSSLFIKGLLISIIITFGSLSMHMQILSINDKIKYIKYIIFRILNVFICIIIYIILFKILL